MVKKVKKLDGNKGMAKDGGCSESDDNGSGLLIGCDSNEDTNVEINGAKGYARRRACNENIPICEKKKKRESYRRISSILRKCETLRTADEAKQLESNADIVRQIFKRRENIANTRDRVLEKEDPIEIIEAKAKKLADVLSRAQHLVCYTGAGISTSARIPDYRGSQGIWTLLQQGKEIGQHDLSLAEPTFTHMALFELHRRNILRYTLSQNCDGLHLRSGLPRKLLSEIHGNMYIEVCKYCKPNVEYWRLFDTTELTARYFHKTNRRCHFCLKPLIDTIVHFGERGHLKWPLNWESACKNAEKADVILCLGSSLKVLKKYSWLWAMDRPKNKRPKVYIVNLQWTPKDKNASLKINGKCDEVMKMVMDFMNIKVSTYNRTKDPIFAHASLLASEEMHTVSQPMLKHHADVPAAASGSIKIEYDDITIAKESNRNCVKSNVDNAVFENSTTTNCFILEKIEDCQAKMESATKIAYASAANISIKMEVDEIDERKINDTMGSLKIDRQVENNIYAGSKSKSNYVFNSENKNEKNSEQVHSKDCLNPTNDSLVPTLTSNNEFSTILHNSKPTNEISTQLNPYQTSENLKKFEVPKNSGIENNRDDDPEKTDDIHNRLGQLLAIKQRTILLQHQKQTNDNAILSGTTLSGAFAVAAAKAVAINNVGDGKCIENGFKNSVSIVDDEDQCEENDYYKSLINYYKAIEGVLPHWYDVNYAYSGLHSIIHPPPNEVDIWSTIIIPIFQLNRNLAECEFCFDNYAEDQCQFYKPSQQFQVKPKRRNGQAILCECCDMGSDYDSEVDHVNTIDDNNGTDDLEDIECIEEQKTNSDEEDEDASGGDGGDVAKRVKLSGNGKEISTKIIQPGWYGKGYRKNMRRKKSRRKYQLP